MQRQPMWTLYFDGGCNLCETGRTRAERWATRAGQPLRAVPLQTAEAVAKGYGDAMVLETESHTFYAAEAWIELLRIAPGAWRGLQWFSLLPGGRWAMKVGYDWVARNRIRWFGARTCALPGPKSTSKRV